MELPRMSAGNRSLVNCSRRDCKPSARASARASVVLPTPGTSSISRCPRASRQATARLMACSFPTMISPIPETSASIRLFMIWKSACSEVQDGPSSAERDEVGKLHRAVVKSLADDGAVEAWHRLEAPHVLDRSHAAAGDELAF